ncbi:hypothetical protein F4778DRAFT_83664 [Xylariomycetidae sp. FL2044]|nr:hypothetical protein F4778DRAFT_83664 [Xylariomycetidae sp. FL2044]
MAPADRLKCPLLRCGESFENHESMLRHLTKCQHFATGEYVCYECMKVERFDDKKCGCCLGHPTKRRRIMNMARSFFATIGHKSRRDHHLTNRESGVVVDPPSYESLVVDMYEQYEQQRRGRQQSHQREGEQEDDQHPQQDRPQLELNGTEIIELDSRQVPTAQLDPVNYDQASMDAYGESVAYNVAVEDASAPSNESREGGLLGTPNGEGIMRQPVADLANRGSHRPALALDTHLDRYRNIPRTKYLSPSTSLRSTKSSSGVSPVTPWSANSGAWTMSSSIGTTMTSPITPFSANENSTTSQAELGLATGKDSSFCPEGPCDYGLGNVSELPGDDPLSKSVPRGVYDPLLFSFDPKENYSWMSSEGTELSLGPSVNMMFADQDPKPAGMPAEFLESTASGSDTKTLVESAWDTLQEHVTSSITKLVQVKGNPLAERLSTQSPRSIAMTGLASLKGILSGTDPSDPLDYLCFIHIGYALSLNFFQDSLITRSSHLYNQALAYRNFLNPAYREVYSQLVEVIWQPFPDEHQSQAGSSLQRSSSSKGEEPVYRRDPRSAVENDPLVAVAQNFLDDVDVSAVSGDGQRPIEILASDLLSLHLSDFQPDTAQNSPFAITANYIISILTQTSYNSADLTTRLGGISQRVHAGYIVTIRRLELEILQAGKSSLAASDLFDRYIPHVKHLCGPIYSQQNFNTRSQYQTLSASLVETLIRNITHEPRHSQDTAAFSMNLSDTFEGLWDGLGKPFGGPMDESGDSFIWNPAVPGHGFGSPTGPNVHTTTPHPVLPSNNNPPATSRSLAPSTPHPEASDESFAPALSDHARAVPAPSTSKSTTPGGPEGSEQSRSGPSSTTGQKVEANDCCDICGYRPKGDPQWFKGSMAKHKKMQHSAGPPIIYKCPFPGCNSQYKNRQDNLRQHQIEKNHFVGDEAVRPVKRKKTTQ